jgi:hypothetical protein
MRATKVPSHVKHWSLPMSNIGGISRLRNFLEMVMERTRENPIRDIFACPQGRVLSY